MEHDLQRLMDFKAEFENLAESSVDESESGGVHGNGGGGGAVDSGDGKWKLRAKKLQKYVKWQLAESANQVDDSLVEATPSNPPPTLEAFIL